MSLRADLQWKAAAPYLILAAISGLYLFPFVRMFCDAPDAGVFLNGADLISHGAIPSRDFVEPQGPGSFLWLALFFRLFGTTLDTARAVLDATGVGLGLLAFYISRRLGATGLFAALFVITMSVPLMPINSPHYDSNLFAFGALAFFLMAWDQAIANRQPDHRLLTGAAILCGITTWMIQQKGLYMLAAMLISIVWLMRSKALRSVLTLVASYCLMLLMPFVAFAILHALPDYLFANYIWPLKKYSELNATFYGFPIWGNLVSQWSRHAALPMARAEDVATSVPFLLVAVLPFLLPAFAKWAGGKWLTTPMLPYWLAAYALWLSELHRLDIGHLRNGVMLLAVLFFSVSETSRRRFLRHLGLVTGIFVALTGAIDLVASLDPVQVLETRRGNIHVLNNAALVEFLESHTHAGDEVFVYPYQPLYYFVEELRNPTRYSYLQYHLHTDDQFREATHDLDRKQVRYVVFDTALSGKHFQEVFPAYRQPETSKLIMEPYLDSHYQLLADLGRFHILKRKPQP